MERQPTPSHSSPRIARRATLLLLGLVALPFAFGCTATPSGKGADPGPFRFGLLADVQYADKDTAGTRRYRESLVSLERCLDDLRTRDLAFVVHCGDIIDGRGSVEESDEDLTRVLDLFAGVGCDVRHVIGNHCLELPRDHLLPRLGLARGHYSFGHGRWRFLVVDSLAFSTCGVPPGSPIHQQATQWLADQSGSGQLNAQAWNGGLGEEQRAWLRDELAAATERGEHAVVFSHLPVLEAASTAHHLLWDHEEVLAILDEAPAFTAWINGHDHAGGFAERNGRSFLTVSGMVDAAPDVNSYAVVEVLPDRLEITGVGNVPSRTLEY